MNRINILQLDPDEFKEEFIAEIISQLKEFYKDLNTADPEQLLTRKETADLLQINLTTLWSHTKSGKLQSYCLGNHRYYKLSEINKALIKIN